MDTPPHVTPDDFPEIAVVEFVSKIITHRYEGETDLEWRERTLDYIFQHPEGYAWALCRPGDEPWHKRLIV